MLGRILLARDGVTAPELQRATGMSPASLHRELDRAETAGLVVRDVSRRPYVYRADTSSPLFDPLHALLRMTVGVETELANALAEIDGVQAAVIYGSRAAEASRARSDIDLLVIGNPDERRLRSTLRRLGKTLGHQIDLTLLRHREFLDLVREDNPFLRTILSRPRIALVGDIDRLEVA
jgi:predicted nucleotidyltransferase